jgi:hypothetical protein
MVQAFAVDWESDPTKERNPPPARLEGSYVSTVLSTFP